MPVTYEFVIEELEDYDDEADIVGVSHETSYRQAVCLAIGSNKPFRIGLVRDVWKHGDLDSRSWAYLEEGDMELPEHFLDAFDNPTAKVPEKFRREVRNFYR